LIFFKNWKNKLGLLKGMKGLGIIIAIIFVTAFRMVFYFRLEEIYCPRYFFTEKDEE